MGRPFRNGVSVRGEISYAKPNIMRKDPRVFPSVLRTTYPLSMGCAWAVRAEARRGGDRGQSTTVPFRGKTRKGNIARRIPRQAHYFTHAPAGRWRYFLHVRGNSTRRLAKPTWSRGVPDKLAFRFVYRGETVEGNTLWTWTSEPPDRA